MTQSARVRRNYSCCFASLLLFKQNISYRDAGCCHRSDREGHSALHHGSHFVYSGAGSTRGCTLHTCSTRSAYKRWCSSLDTDGGQNLERCWFDFRLETEQRYIYKSQKQTDFTSSSSALSQFGATSQVMITNTFIRFSQSSPKSKKFYLLQVFYAACRAVCEPFALWRVHKPAFTSRDRTHFLTRPQPLQFFNYLTGSWRTGWPLTQTISPDHLISIPSDQSQENIDAWDNTSLKCPWLFKTNEEQHETCQILNWNLLYQRRDDIWGDWGCYNNTSGSLKPTVHPHSAPISAPAIALLVVFS